MSLIGVFQFDLYESLKKKVEREKQLKTNEEPKNAYSDFELARFENRYGKLVISYYKARWRVIDIQCDENMAVAYGRQKYQLLIFMLEIDNFHGLLLQFDIASSIFS